MLNKNWFGCGDKLLVCIGKSVILRLTVTFECFIPLVCSGTSLFSYDAEKVWAGPGNIVGHFVFRE